MFKLFKKKKKENDNKNEMCVTITVPEMKKYMKGIIWNVTTIPEGCYVDNANSPNSEKYEIFYDGKKVIDVFGIIRYSPQTFSDKDRCNEINWRKKLGE